MGSDGCQSISMGLDIENLFYGFFYTSSPEIFLSEVAGLYDHLCLLILQLSY